MPASHGNIAYRHDEVHTQKHAALAQAHGHNGLLRIEADSIVEPRRLRNRKIVLAR